MGLSLVSRIVSRPSALMARLALANTIPVNARIIAVTLPIGGVVPTVIVACDWFAAIVTDAGAVAYGKLDDRLTTLPLGPAGPVKVTVPVEDDPPTTAVGLSVRDCTTAGLIMRLHVGEA